MGKLIDLIGKKFGMLTVVNREYPNQKDGLSRWLCKCDCGTERIITSYRVRRGYIKGCDCLVRVTPGLASMRQVMSDYKIGAKIRGLEFNLTEDQFSEITKKDCYYCGAQPNNLSGRKRSSGSYIYNGLDRIDNTKGYTIDNVVTCCKICNISKQQLSLQEFKDWSKRLYRKMFVEEVIL